MGFLQRFFRTTSHSNQKTTRPSSFEHASDSELEEHLEVAHYGNFELTDAIRPSYDLTVIPSEGYRNDTYYDEANQEHVPVLLAAASKEKLFDLFLELLSPLGDQVDLVLETSHCQDQHQDLYREHIDLPVAKSVLYDYEDMLLNDGCSGIAVLNPEIPQEVQFDEHKLLIIYGKELEEFEYLMQGQGLKRNDQMKFITEAEHVHSSSEKHRDQFEQLRMILGVEDESGLNALEDDELYA